MSWYNYYKSIVGKHIHEVNFTKKYLYFLKVLSALLSPGMKVLEMGCGTSIVTKLLYNSKTRFIVADNCRRMTFLSRINLGQRKVKVLLADITKPLNFKVDLLHSHGVLEHFTKEQIKDIVRTQLTCSKILVHYVPSNKYKVKSFGNELLLSKKQWFDLVKPSEILEFNKGLDLILIWRN
jgi:cyclopropane fatty-acyl-phospholipid synthase-like methyltransferase